MAVQVPRYDIRNVRGLKRRQIQIFEKSFFLFKKMTFGLGTVQIL